VSLDEVESAIRKLGVRAVKLIKVCPHFFIAVVVMVYLVSVSNHFVHASADLLDSQRFGLLSRPRLQIRLADSRGWLRIGRCHDAGSERQNEKCECKYSHNWSPDLLSAHRGPRTDEHELTVPSFHVIVAAGFRTQYEIASLCSGVRGGAGAGACAVVPKAGETEDTGTAGVEGAATGVEVDEEAEDIGDGGV
jgi:hypothetical protein